jgi:hypothetical protein
MYYGDLKSDCTKKCFLKNVAIYIMDTITKKNYCTLSFASKIDLVWSYLSQNMGLFQPRKVQIQTKKEKKFSRSQENEVRRVIFSEMLLFIQ